MDDEAKSSALNRTDLNFIEASERVEQTGGRDLRKAHDEIAGSMPASVVDAPSSNDPDRRSSGMSAASRMRAFQHDRLAITMAETGMHYAEESHEYEGSTLSEGIRPSASAVSGWEER